MTTLRTRLERAICVATEDDGRCFCAIRGGPDSCPGMVANVDAVLAVLGSPSDAEVERVARGIAALNGLHDWTQ